MGFYSFITQDTGRSISNVHAPRPTFTVYMHGNGDTYREDGYPGNGRFAGKCFFELLAEMNGSKQGIEITPGEGIEIGIDIYYNAKDKKIIYPQLTESPTYPDDFKQKPESCPDQGYFYEPIKTR